MKVKNNNFPAFDASPQDVRLTACTDLHRAKALSEWIQDGCKPSSKFFCAWGFAEAGSLIGRPKLKDHSILESILGRPVLGNPPHVAARRISGGLAAGKARNASVAPGGLGGSQNRGSPMEVPSEDSILVSCYHCED